MRGFIYRRVELIAQGIGDAVLLGSIHCASTLRIKDFLHAQRASVRLRRSRSRARRRGAARSASRRRRRHAGADLPRRDRPAQSVATTAIAGCLGFNANIDRAHVRDLLVVGRGSGRPGGGGLRRVGRARRARAGEQCALAGRRARAPESRTISDFPLGVSGQRAGVRALTQAQKFGAEIMVASGSRVAASAAGSRTPSRARRRHASCPRARSSWPRAPSTGGRPSRTSPRFQGAGVYYSATPMEAQLCAGEDVIIVGGGNSAGQAAVFLAGSPGTSTCWCGAKGLAETMSRYLIRRIEDSPSIDAAHANGAQCALEGGNHLESVRWRDSRTGGDRDAPDPSRVPDDRSGPQHALAGWLYCARRQGVRQDGQRPDDRRISPRRSGRCRGRRISSRPAVPACSPSVTFAAAA